MLDHYIAKKIRKDQGIKFHGTIESVSTALGLTIDINEVDIVD